MTALTIIIVVLVLVVVLAAAAFVVQRKNREANLARAEQLRAQAATTAQATIAPAQERAAEAEAEAAEARAVAEQAEAEAEQARTAAQQEEAAHEGQIRAADRLDPRVDHKADDYTPQVAGGTDQQPTAPAEVNAEPAPETPDEATDETTDETTDEAPLLPRRTPGAQEMPGKPIEQSDGGGGWFTKGSDPGKS